VQLWEEGMKEEIESIGEEKWMVLEQVAWDSSENTYRIYEPHPSIRYDKSKYFSSVSDP
jgi:hypothetical protein